jgi:hypothetical protein
VHKTVDEDCVLGAIPHDLPLLDGRTTAPDGLHLSDAESGLSLVSSQEGLGHLIQFEKPE